MPPTTLAPPRPPTGNQSIGNQSIGNQSIGRNTGDTIMLEVDERREIVSRESTPSELSLQTLFAKSIGNFPESCRNRSSIRVGLTSGDKSEGANRDLAPSTAPASGPVAPPARGRIATSDMDEQYRLVINRHNRLNQLIEMRAPAIIIRNEKRMLRAAVEALFDDGEVMEIIDAMGNGVHQCVVFVVTEGHGFGNVGKSRQHRVVVVGR